MNNSLLVFNFIVCLLGCFISFYALFSNRLVTIDFHRCIYLALLGIIFGLWLTFSFIFTEHLRVENSIVRLIVLFSLITAIRGMKCSDGLINKVHIK